MRILEILNFVSFHTQGWLTLLHCRKNLQNLEHFINLFGMQLMQLNGLKGLSHEIEMNYKWYKATEPY
jgi:hypothetical protein